MECPITNLTLETGRVHYYVSIVFMNSKVLKQKYQDGFLSIFVVLCEGQGSLAFFW